MRYLDFDWETDGLNISGQPSDHPDQPGAVSLSAILEDHDGSIITTMDTLVIPVREIPPDVVAIHGITFEKASKEGKPIDEVMREFARLAEMADVLSAFNFFFDFKMAKIGCARMGEPGEAIRRMLETKQSVCTMDGARKHLGTGRFCKLTVAHERLLGEPHTRAHESMADAQASRRIRHELQRLGALPEPKSMARKTYATPAPTYTPKPKALTPEAAARTTAAPVGKPGKPAGFSDF